MFFTCKLRKSTQLLVSRKKNAGLFMQTIKTSLFAKYWKLFSAVYWDIYVKNNRLNQFDMEGKFSVWLWGNLDYEMPSNENIHEILFSVDMGKHGWSKDVSMSVNLKMIGTCWGLYFLKSKEGTLINNKKQCTEWCKR